MAEKKSNREKLSEITASIERGIKELFESDRYVDYLQTMSRFHSYSVRNTILIHMQRPDATVVAGFNAWKKKFQRHVKKGEKGITILAPTPYKKKIEEKKLDPVTKSPMLDRDGNVIMEEKEVEIPLFRPVKVFDVSQTEGKPLPQLGGVLTGDVQNYEIFMEALRRTSPVPITIGPINGEMDGFFRPSTQSITVREGMSEVQTISVTIHEITHSLLHNQEQERISAAAGTEQAAEIKRKDRNTEEVEAESVSYTVCQYYGIQTGEDSFGYIASWSKNRELPELKASLDTIGKTAHRLITDIDRHFKEICQERGIDLTAQEAEAPDSFERFAADLYDYLDDLYQTGIVEHRVTLDSKETFTADIVSELERGCWDEIRSSLVQFAENPHASEACVDPDSACQASAADAKRLLDRLYALEKNAKQLEQKYIYKMEANPRCMGTEDTHIIQKYEVTESQTLIPQEVLCAGDSKTCLSLLEKLQNGELQPDDLRQESLVAADSPQVNTDEALYLVDGTTYLHIQTTDDSYDYTLYDKESGRQLDGGQMSVLDVGGQQADLRTAADLIILGEHTLTGISVEPVSLEMADTLREAADHITQEIVSEMKEQRQEILDELRTHFAAEDEALWETRLDEYPMPDPAFFADELEQNYGYMDDDLLPLSKERAAELLERDLTIYMVQSGENPAMVFDREELEEQPSSVIFAVPRDEWEASEDFRQAVADRMNHQEEREKAFLDHGRDCFALYQLSFEKDTLQLRYEPLNTIQTRGFTVQRSNYDLAYTGELPPGQDLSVLDKLWEQFNINHPADYQRPSLSMSDIIAIKQDGVVSCHYCDRIGFTEIHDFIRPENYLKNAEMATEDDLSMIDGIINNGAKEGPSVAELEAQVKAGQTISLMDLADAVHREEAEKKKKSVREKLKTPPEQKKKRTAPKKSAERDR